MKYVVIGATGNTGHIVADELLKDGQSVRVVGRSADKLTKLTALGAEACIADLQNADEVKRAFEGVEAAYIMIPPNFAAPVFRKYQDEVTDHIADAMASCGTKYAVCLSSVGADQSKGVGPINGLHYMEKQFDGIPDLNTLHIRAGFFMENLFGSLGMIKHMKIYGVSSPAELLQPLIASNDIGHYAANRLKALNFNGKNIQYLLGQRDVSGQETAAILGAVLGIEALPYIQFSNDDMRNGMIGAGIPEQFADLYVEMYDGFNSGLLGYRRDSESTTNTKLEDFAKFALKPAFDAM